MKSKVMINNLPYDLIDKCTEQCTREILFKDPSNLNSERKYHEASTVEVKHYDEEETSLISNKYSSLSWARSNDTPEFIYSDHIEKVEIYVTRYLGYDPKTDQKTGAKDMLLKVNHTVYGEGGYRSTDYYELILNEVVWQSKAVS